MNVLIYNNETPSCRHQDNFIARKKLSQCTAMSNFLFTVRECKFSFAVFSGDSAQGTSGFLVLKYSEQ